MRVPSWRKKGGVNEAVFLVVVGASERNDE